MSAKLNLPEELHELARELPLTLGKQELCDLLKVERSTIERAVRHRQIKCIKTGDGRSSRVIFPRYEVLRWMSERVR